MFSPISDFVSLIFPRVCVHCSTALTRKEEFLCLECELSLPKRSEWANKEQLLKKFAFQPKVIAAYAYLEFIKEGIAQKLIHKLKYQNKKELGIWLGTKYGGELKTLNDLPNFDLMIPSPLHPNRARQRGYNQSEQIALGLSKSLDIPVFNQLVSRIRETTSQTRKSKVKRWENMDQVFAVNEPSAIEGKDILLVDDVITSGATIGMLCDELAKVNPNTITLAALASGK
jgi:ComF family protein